jgi:beta-glucanase (GH16 family)
MDKGSFNNFIKGNTAHRFPKVVFPKVVTLAVSSCLLVGMIAIDASASDSTPAAVTYVTTIHTVSWNRTQLTEFANHWQTVHSFSLIKPLKLRKIKVTTPVTSPVTTTTAAPPTTTTIASPPVTTTTAAPPTTTTTATAPPTTTTTAAAPPTTTTTAAAPPTTTTTAASAPSLSYPIGTPDSSEPSGFAPPSANALAGYSQTYVTNFPGSSLPAAWGSYEGQPGGDSGAQFDQNHVIVSGGLLQIKTYQDPAFNNQWVTGGTCLCNIASQTYGAYFVRSRLTGPGPTGVELLWPTANVWPPEIDFNETLGGVSSTTATVHYTSANSQIGRSFNIDMTQWHTWGVIWTSSSITYTVDGNVWASVTTPSVIPNIPMHLSLQSQTWCSSGWACPSSPQALQVNWVAQYGAN